MKKIFFVLFILIFAVCLTLPPTDALVDDLTEVRQSGELRFGVSPDYIPFVFYDRNGQLTGIDVALMEEIGRRMQMKVTTVNIAFDGITDSLNYGQIDVIGGALSKTDERSEIIDFTSVYYTGDAKFIGLSTLNLPQTFSYGSLQGLKIGAEKGTSFDQWIKTNLVSPGYVEMKNVFVFSSAAEEIKALDRGTVDLVLIDQDIYEELYRPTGKYKIFYEGFTKENYAFGTRKNSSLTGVINGHLKDMLKDGTAQQIANRFFRMDFTEAEPTAARSSQLPTPTAPAVSVQYTAPAYPTQAPLPAGTDYMTFVSDVTITDGHQVRPNEKFRKTWLVKNTGNTTWTPAYTLMYVSGDKMNGQTINIPGNVAPGQTVRLSVDLTAPRDKGTYRGYWQMCSPYGRKFGETIWVKVRVRP